MSVPHRKTTPFVGRGAEIEFLAGCVEEALAGKPQTVLVQGEAGIGKSSLLKETRALARRRLFQVGSGRARSNMAIPYLCQIEALEPLVDTVRAEPEGVRSDLELVDNMFRAGQSPLANEADTPARYDQLRLFQAVSRLVIRAAEIRPTLISIDDLHWADPSSAALLAHLIFAAADDAETAPLQLMIVCGHRPWADSSPIANALASVMRQDIASVVELGGLDDQSLVDLLEGLGVPRPSARLVQTVQDLTLGNPLFAEEVVLHLRKTKALSTSGGRTTLKRVPDLRLPQTVVSALQERSRGISEPCRSALGTAACLGDAFDLRLLAAIREQPYEAILELFDESGRAAITHADGLEYHFTHPLLRHVFHTTLAPSERQRTHLRIADQLESESEGERNERIQELAYHLLEAGAHADAARVARVVRRAGEQAFAFCAWAEAARYFDAALAQAHRDPDVQPLELARLYHVAGQALFRTQEADAAMERFDRAIELFRAAGDVRGRLLAEMDRARVFVTLAAVAYGTLPDLGGLREALDDLGDRDELLRGFALALLAQVYWTARKPQDAIAAAREALEIGRRRDNHPLASDGASGMALALSQILDIADAVEFHEMSIHHGHLAGDPWREAFGAHRLPIAHVWLGRLDEAEERALDAERLTRETEEWSGASVAMAARVAIAVLRGDLHTAEDLAARIKLLADRSQYPWGGYNALPSLAAGYYYRGDIARSKQTLEKVVERGFLFKEPGPAIGLAIWTYQQLLETRLGLNEQQRRDLVGMIEQINTPENVEIGVVPVYCALAEIADRLDVPGSLDSIYQVVRFAWDKRIVFTTAWTFLVPRVLAVLEMRRGNLDRARELFDEATHLARQTDVPTELGRAHLDHARLLLKAGAAADRERAATLLAEACALFETWRMADFADEAGALARSAGLRLDDGRDEPESTSPQTVPDPTTIDEVLNPGQGNGQRSASPPAPATARPRGPRDPSPGRFDSVVIRTDMVESTKMIERLGDQRAREVMDSHNEIVTQSFRRFGVEQVRFNGDGYLAIHSSRDKAIRCALHIQAGCARYNEKHPMQPIQIRIGIDFGPVWPLGNDLHGRTVNLASRLCSKAEPDEIVASDAVTEGARLLEYLVRRHETGRFKGFEAPQGYTRIAPQTNPVDLTRIK